MELLEKVEIKVGVLGTGCCGNQIVKLAAKENFKSVALNSTAVDTVGIDENDNCCVLLIGKEGCGKSRNVAKGMVQKTFSKLVQSLSEIYSDCEIVVTTGAVNNGTGSGTLPILSDILKNVLKKKVIAMPIMPSDRTLRSMSNSLSCMQELDALGITYIPLDNSKAKELPLEEMYRVINEDALNNLKIIRGDFIKSREPKYDNIDKKDLVKLVTTPGVLRIAKMTGIKDNATEIDRDIISSILNNYGPELEMDKVVDKIGTIYHIKQNNMSYIDKDHNELIKLIGRPKDVFDHYEIADDESYIITIMSGLSSPVSLMSDYQKVLDENVEVEKKSLSSLSLNLLDDDDEFDEDKEEEIKEVNVNDFMKKYL